MPDAPELIEAEWLPAYTVELPDGRTVNPGDRAQISAGEAAASEHWKPVKAAKPAASAAQE